MNHHIRVVMTDVQNMRPSAVFARSPRVGWRAKLRHDHLKPALQVGDVGSRLIGLAQGEGAFVGHADVLAE